MGVVQGGRQRSPHLTEGKLTPYLRVANVFDGYIDTSDVLEMPFTEAEFARYVLRPNDLLLNEGQSLELVGRCAKYEGEPEKFCFQNTLLRFQAGINCDTDYAYQLFRWCQYSGVFAKIATKTNSIAHLGATRFSELELPFPTLPEQRKIAAILSTWDDSLSTLTRLIVTKRQQKRVLAEQLLTGERRLKGFEGERKMKKFGEIFRTVSAKSLQIEKSEYQAVGEIAVVDQGQKTVAAYISGRPAFLEIPVIVFGDHTRTVKWIDFPFAPGADGTVLLKASPGMENKYGFYILEVLSIPNLGYSRHLKLLKEMVFPIPTLPEQQVITSILTTLDDEISALERLQVSVQEQKRGLMDALLTGRVRVNVKDA